MSWESNETEKPCPCGKSTYTVIDRSDDWGRYETHWRMDCPICEKTYSLYVYDYYRSGLPEQGHKWVEKGIYDQSMELEGRSKAAKNQAVRMAEDRYLPVLVDMFSNSSKKSIWQALSANIKWYKSLGTFYKHTKNKEKEEFLSELFSYSDLLSVLRVANAEDEEIKELLKSASAFESEAKALLHG